MKKKYTYLIVFLITLFTFIPNIRAASHYGVVSTDVLRVRSGPGTNHSQVAQLTIGTSKDLINLMMKEDVEEKAGIRFIIVVLKLVMSAVFILMLMKKIIIPIIPILPIIVRLI